MAKNWSVLRKRVERLLQVKNQERVLGGEILPYLQTLGSVALIGGAIRDVARAGRSAFNSDLDFVIYGSSRDIFKLEMKRVAAKPNKFGGYSINYPEWKVDLWHIEDTWAHTSGHVDVQRPNDLLRCTFFDWDSVLFDIATSKIIAPADYLLRLRLGIMDIRLEPNPNPYGSAVRALRRAAHWGVGFGPHLTAFILGILERGEWEALREVDSAAFHHRVLAHLEESEIITRLKEPIPSKAGFATYPVPHWRTQPDFFDGTDIITH